MPAAMLSLLGALRIAASGTPGTTSLLVLVVGVAWEALALAGLLVPGLRRWVVRRRLEWCLSAVSLLLCLVIADLVLTLTGVVPTLAAQRARSPGYTFGAFNSYRMVPKDIEVDGGEPIHVNRRGFRGPEIEPVKPPGRRRIVFLGGSQVFDYHGGDWPALVGERLRERGHDVEVINAGVAGHTSLDAVAKLLTDLWLVEPDILFVCSAWNDLKYFARLSPQEPYRGLPPLEPTSWRRDWRLYPEGLDRVLSVSSVYRHFRWGLVELLFTEEGFDMDDWQPRRSAFAGGETFGRWGPRQYRLNLELIAELGERQGARTVLCRQAHRTQGRGSTGIDLADYARRNLAMSLAEIEQAYEIAFGVLDEVARGRGLHVVDMHGALSANPAYFRDAVHFDPAGSRAAAEVVADALAPLLAEQPAPPPSPPAEQ